MKLIYFSGFLKAPDNPEDLEKLEGKLMDVLTGEFNEELETASCGVEEISEGWTEVTDG